MPGGQEEGRLDYKPEHAVYLDSGLPDEIVRLSIVGVATAATPFSSVIPVNTWR
jgi:hypothetical protein